jgi:hypothetical protein
MSYAQAKEIALLRLSLRACWANGDRAGAVALLAQLTAAAGNDNDLVAETRRWAIKLATG